MASDSSFVKNKFVLASLLIILVAALAVYINSTTGFLTFRPIINQYGGAHTTLTSYAGTAPVLDGVITDLDKWGEADTSVTSFEQGNVKISSKHDNKYIYFLVQWDDPSPAWNDGVAFYFEDDGEVHDHSLDGKYDYSFKNLPEGCKVIAGSYWTQGASDWTPGGADFDVGCSHEKRQWTMEVKHALSSAIRKDKVFDISLYQNRKKILGFAVVNWESGVAGGEGLQSWNWPVDKKLGLASGASPSEPATWGDLKIAWTPKEPAAKKKVGIKR